MENAINTLRIQNFKSIKDVTMQPRRVNLIIGPPNVGKSNILEAMSLLGGGNKMEDNIRYEELRQLFYDNDIKNIIKVNTNSQYVFFGRAFNHDFLEYLFIDKHSFDKLKQAAKISASVHKINYPFDDNDGWIMQNLESRLDSEDGKYIECRYRKISIDGKILRNENRFLAPHVGKKRPNYDAKPYFYKKGGRIDFDTYGDSLMTPNGENLVRVIQSFSALRKEIAQMFTPYSLKLMVKVDQRRLEVIKDLDGVIYSYPYSSIADTLQRIIFYLAAIESNDDAVILFEEPEAHSYPQYVSILGKRIAASRNNQFFVATHSPYLLTEILEQMLPDEEQASELAIFVAYYEDYQTKVKQLSDEEMRAIRGDSVDVFYNMNRYIPRPANG